MGDSISEGAVVEWTKAVGEGVAEDDVVVVLETDKVSIDVRSDHSGVLTAQLAEVDESVLVGAPLFELELGEGGTAPAAATNTTTAAAATPPPPAAVAVAADAHAGDARPPPRIPSIQFLGKRALLAHGGGTAAAAAAQGAAPSAVVHTEGALEFAALPPLYGRLALSEAEMAAVDGGIDDDLLG
eukprot:g1687.t1